MSRNDSVKAIRSKLEDTQHKSPEAKLIATQQEELMLDEENLSDSPEENEFDED